MKIRFLGATGTVTGSKYLLESGKSRILLDCGLFQGLKKLRLKNRAPFPIDPGSIQAVALTHAHIDHSGYLPLLRKNGFSGPVYCTAGTKELCSLLLPDSGYLQEEEARFANKHGYSKHRPALPLYTQVDAQNCLAAFKTVPFREQITLAGPFTATFVPAGHILGSACVYISDGRHTIAFSGDLGRPENPVMRPPSPLEATDYLVLESTYGNRRHDPTDPKKLLQEVITRTVKRGGVVLIPSFAIGRAQTLLHLIAELKQEKAIPPVPVFLNSPMAINATEIFCRHANEHRLNEAQCRKMCEGVEFVRTVEASKALNQYHGPRIIISASGMATGGRILHHLKVFAPDPKNTILFTGFQAAGTRGEAMVNGVDSVKIHGQYYPVRAEIVSIHSLSAHADYVEIGQWLATAKQAPKRTFLTHGEPAASDALRRYLRDQLGWNFEIPEEGEEIPL